MRLSAWRSQGWSGGRPEGEGMMLEHHVIAGANLEFQRYDWCILTESGTTFG